MLVSALEKKAEHIISIKRIEDNKGTERVSKEIKPA